MTLKLLRPAPFCGLVQPSKGKCAAQLCLAIAAFAWPAAQLVEAAPEPAQELIARGDACERNLQTEQALEFYLAAEKLDPKDADLLVCIARQYRHLMHHCKSDEQKLKFGEVALQYGQRAAALEPKNSDAVLSEAISYGKMLPYQGARQQVANSPKIKACAERAIHLNPRNDTAWNVLGRWHRVLADVGGVKRTLASVIYGNLPEGSNEEAVKCFQNAIEIAPQRIIHHVELGRVYAQMGEENKAKTTLEKALAMRSTEKDDAQAKVDARAVLEKLQ